MSYTHHFFVSTILKVLKKKTPIFCRIYVKVRLVTKFCPKCGIPLVEKKEDNKIYLACPLCGYKEELVSEPKDVKLVPNMVKSEIEKQSGFDKVAEDTLKIGGHISEELAKEVIEHFRPVEELEE